MSDIIKKEYVDEFEKGYNLRTALEEAARCLLCHDAPCSNDCPAGTDPGKFIRSIRFRNFKGAAETIRENNPLGGSCARVCPYDRLCEKACSKCGIDRPINIGKLQRFAIEQEKIHGMKILSPKESIGKKVALIGAGPASIGCAFVLAQRGVECIIFEKESKAGGMLTFGIPEIRLPQEVIDHDIEQLKDLGVEIKFNHLVDDDAWKKLMDEYDAIFVGIGLWKFPVPEIDGSDLEGVLPAGDYLKEAKENGGSKISKDKNVVVIGGGDVAMDCAVTAKLSKAKSVQIIYRRTIEEAPCNIAELKLATEMGIPMTNNMAPAEIIGEGGKVKMIAFNERDGKGGMRVSADLVVFAIGQKPGFDGVKPDEKKIFAGGDIVNGGKTVVEAVKEGKEQAFKILSAIK